MVTSTTDAKVTPKARRRCINCHETSPPSWRKSILHIGGFLCNKCGIYERTHKQARPLKDGSGRLRRSVQTLKEPERPATTTRLPLARRTQPPACQRPKLPPKLPPVARRQSTRLQRAVETPPDAPSVSPPETPIRATTPRAPLRLAALDMDTDSESSPSTSPSSPGFEVISVRLKQDTLDDHLIRLMPPYIATPAQSNFLGLCLDPLEALRRRPELIPTIETGQQIRCLPEVLSAPTLWQVNVSRFPQLKRVLIYTAEIRQQLDDAQRRFPNYWKTFVGYDEMSPGKMVLIANMERLLPSVSTLPPAMLYACKFRCSSCEQLGRQCIYASTASPSTGLNGASGAALVCCLGCASQGQSCFHLSPAGARGRAVKGRMFLRTYDFPTALWKGLESHAPAKMPVQVRSAQ